MKKKLRILLTASLFLSFFLINSIHADTLNTNLNKTEYGEQKSVKPALAPTTGALPLEIEKPKPSKYTIMTENFPPFNYMEKGELVGISTEIVQEILKRLNMENVPIKAMDWDKAYQATLEEPNTIIYSLTRIRLRESNFKWVGPIATEYWFLYSKKLPISEEKNDKITVNKLQEAKKYSIGVQDQGANYLYLKSKGFDNLVLSVSNKESAENLINGKVQLWAESELVAASLLLQLNEKPDILQKTFKLRKQNLYIGFNINTPDALVKKFQETLDQMKNDGTYDEIINKYYNKIYVDTVKESSIDDVHSKNSSS